MFVTNEENLVANNSNSSRKSLGFLYIHYREHVWLTVVYCLKFDV